LFRPEEATALNDLDGFDGAIGRGIFARSFISRWNYSTDHLRDSVCHLKNGWAIISAKSATDTCLLVNYSFHSVISPVYFCRFQKHTATIEPPL